MADRSGKSGSSYRFPLLGLLNHCRWWLQLWNQKTIFSCQETYDKPRQWVEKQRITLSTKICIVRAIPVVTYSCDSWTLSKAKHQRINAFELWFWRRLPKVPGTARISNKSILKEINPEYSLEGQMLKSWNSIILVIWCEQLTHWKSPWYWGRLRTEGEEGVRAWDG